jgi:hypothetical protein
LPLSATSPAPAGAATTRAGPGLDDGGEGAGPGWVGGALPPPDPALVAGGARNRSASATGSLMAARPDPASGGHHMLPVPEESGSGEGPGGAAAGGWRRAPVPEVMAAQQGARRARLLSETGPAGMGGIMRLAGPVHGGPGGLAGPGREAARDGGPGGNAWSGPAGGASEGPGGSSGGIMRLAPAGRGGLGLGDSRRLPSAWAAPDAEAGGQPGAPPNS